MPLFIAARASFGRSKGACGFLGCCSMAAGLRPLIRESNRDEILLTTQKALAKGYDGFNPVISQ